MYLVYIFQVKTIILKLFVIIILIACFFQGQSTTDSMALSYEKYSHWFNSTTRQRLADMYIHQSKQFDCRYSGKAYPTPRDCKMTPNTTTYDCPTALGSLEATPLSETDYLKCEDDGAAAGSGTVTLYAAATYVTIVSVLLRCV